MLRSTLYSTSLDGPQLILCVIMSLHSALVLTCSWGDLAIAYLKMGFWWNIDTVCTFGLFCDQNNSLMKLYTCMKKVK